ncbi:MFS transporter [Bordetella sp. BOR01]|uniref:MFS transporter n=1 Tax=Bordetella sp. BOR01 TaxID=2854779 RepID=UPI002103DF3C|nr:MFS transporter [Bordetella sp. BOR01]
MPIRQIALVAAVCLGTFITVLDISIVNVALPTLQTALNIDMAGLQWVVDIYALCLSAFMLSAGPLGDRYGRRRAWLGGVVLFVLGSAVCAAAAGLPVLLAGRAVQGVAGALLIPGWACWPSAWACGAFPKAPIQTMPRSTPPGRRSASAGWAP